MVLENYFDELQSALTVMDTDGKILYLNEKAIITFQKYGGKSLIGKNIYDCHQETSNQKIHEMLATGGENVYTIEKDGVKKLIYQTPWKKDGVVMGLMEFSIVLPEKMPHFIR
ncbi:MAG: PAS sensor protein [Bdellovibrionales bacterium RIFOXYB1_FULL_37_110]|nr:MAG: PAS sensor protein [Bdellovibrionales bacterium RIFOXYC1_FULL_37_79]OFZ60672.1 MAG: PAS sensor protein [Bdellovibrionales bacterium RIFOXYB1_FULL_37_110]OFZ64424.1 MAG: PAS sensor protein [Bdellovibrionales bacterium RIFOXYD1_FULL_36_51]